MSVENENTDEGNQEDVLELTPEQEFQKFESGVKKTENPESDKEDDSSDEEDLTDEESDSDDSTDEESNSEKKRPSDKNMQAFRLKRERDEANARVAAAEERAKAIEEKFAELEQRLTGANQNSNSTVEEELTPPDHTDSEKYPLGILDPQYHADIREFDRNQVTKEITDAVLQRQKQSDQEKTEAAQREAMVKELGTKIEGIAEKGKSISDDYQQKVIETGLKGEWKLSQPAFDTAAETENGEKVLYDLATNPDEAARVFDLPFHQQVAYVLDKAREAGASKRGRKFPGAGDPPASAPKGRSGKSTFDPATTDFAAFEAIAKSKN